MKYLLLFFLSFHLLPSFAQEATNYLQPDNQYSLVAESGKHVRKYVDRQPLKIEYRNNDETIKAKGRLVFYSKDEIRLLPYGKKDTIGIKINSIESIRRWNRPGKKAIIILAGTGVVATGLGALAYNDRAGNNNLLGLCLIVYAAADLYSIAIALPVVYISEWFSIRSAKKGYHFYVEEKKVSN